MGRPRAWWAACLLGLAIGARAQGPFGVDVETGRDAAGALRLDVRLSVPEGYHVYAGKVSVQATGAAIEPVSLPTPVRVYDAFLGEDTDVFDRDVVFVYRVPGGAGNAMRLEVSLQGCSETLCYPPLRRVFRVAADGRVDADAAGGSVFVPPADGGEPDSWQREAESFRVAAREAGYLKPAAFLAFLDRAQSGAADEGRLETAWGRRGIWLTLVLILLGGLALNLTPCVLPMIPINLGLIGAGVQAGSRARGFALGGAYGAGVALVYGGLGLVVILTGSRFGALNSSPWFNLAIAGVFVCLSLAMFDVFTLDFSRFQGRAAGAGRGGSYVAALVLGGMAALLAGACVAPVLVSVLVLAAGLYAGGNPAGLALPFVLGLGMALPWPFAGAGLSFLPRPGRWMMRVKVVFGVAILLFAAWYGRLGVSLLLARRAADRAAVVAVQAQSAQKDGWHTELAPALREAAASGRPLLIDFWASWCKNCLQMEKSTFRDEAVRERLDSFVKAKLQAEDLSEPATRELLDHFEVVGLPTYVVVAPSRGRPAGDGR